MKILFLSRWYPHPPDNGSKIRIYHLLKGLAGHHKITLVSFYEDEKQPEDLEDIEFCQETYLVPWKSYNPKSKRSLIGFFSPIPRSVVDTYSLEMTETIQNLTSKNHYDIVIASQIGMAHYTQNLQNIPMIFEEVELGVLYEQYVNASSPLRKLRYGLTWKKHRDYLSNLLKHYKACTVVSRQERDLLSLTVPGFERIEVIPNCIDVADYKNIEETLRPKQIVFTGSFTYFPNYEGMYWFLEAVFPKILEMDPEVQLAITGNHDKKPLPSNSALENINLTGFLDDIRPLVASSAISVVPIRAGGGTRLKILEAMALGTPVVSTRKGAEGLDVHNGHHLLIADSADEFAQQVLHLLKNLDLSRKLSRNAYELVREHYNWEVVMPKFLNLIEETAAKKKKQVI